MSVLHHRWAKRPKYAKVTSGRRRTLRYVSMPMKASSRRAAGAALRVPHDLTKREQHAIDYITACGYHLNAYSIWPSVFDLSESGPLPN